MVIRLLEMPKELFNVDEREDVARILFEPSMVAGDRVTAGAFALTILASGDEEEYLSVWRTKIKTPTRDNVKIKPREEGDTLFGYARLAVSTIHRQDVAKCKARVKRDSPKHDAYHVGVYYYLNSKQIIGKHLPKELLLLLSRIAKNAIVYKFPPIEVSEEKNTN